jgi:hypothetical protein
LAGAEARVFIFMAFAARLKSCPDAAHAQKKIFSKQGRPLLPPKFVPATELAAVGLKPAADVDLCVLLAAVVPGSRLIGDIVAPAEEA